MKECCEVRVDVPERQRRLLWVVLCINGAMFLVELIAGITASSTALLADSVDMLGDAIVYGVSLYVVARGAVWQAHVARLKGLIMAAFGVGVLAQVVTKLLHGLHPNADTMGVVGSLALAANTVTEAQRRAVIAARLPVHDWPSRRLAVVAVDAHSGESRVFDHESDVDLVDAVAASCAVPGCGQGHGRDWPSRCGNWRNREPQWRWCNWTRLR